MLLVSREWQATARKTSCLQKRGSRNIPLNRADVSSRNLESLEGLGLFFQDIIGQESMLFLSLCPPSSSGAWRRLSLPLPPPLCSISMKFLLLFFRVMLQICPSGLFILLPIYSSQPAPVLVGLKGWRQRGACLGCSGETSQRRDHVLLICHFRLGEFSLHKLMWLGKVFWECCFVVGDLGAWWRQAGHLISPLNAAI